MLAASLSVRVSWPPGKEWACRESLRLGLWTTWRETGYFSHLWSFLHCRGTCFGKLSHDPKSWGMLKILATGRKKTYVFIHCLFWQDSVQNAEKSRVIPIDLAGFEWNSKCLILDSSGACASEAGEELSSNKLFFLQLFHAQTPASFLSSAAGCMAVDGSCRWGSDHPFLYPCRSLCPFPTQLSPLGDSHAEV